MAGVASSSSLTSTSSSMAILLRLAVVFASLPPPLLAEFRPHVVGTSLLWEPGVEGEVGAYRIPVAARSPGGSLVALAEARKYASSDYGAKFLAMRRSFPDPDGSGAGDSWTASEFLVDDFQIKDGLNLGSILVDEEAGTLLVLYCVCIHTACPSMHYLGSNYLLRSRDWGLTWEPPVDIAKANSALFNNSWSAGPGYGIQKRYAPHKGRLIVCGHTNDLSKDLEMFCIVSDDHGDTWKKAASMPHIPFNGPLSRGDFAPTEVQMVELRNGTILFNVRNEGSFHCHCRMVMSSYDGAKTIPLETVRLDPTLVDPACAGSLLLHDSSDNNNDDDNDSNGILFFSNAANAEKRVNLTLRWSRDDGASWEGALVVDPGPSMYSCLTAIDGNHVGIVYEQGLAGLWFVKVRLYV